MSSRKGVDVIASGESQKQTPVAAKTKQKRISNASDSPPGTVTLAKKPVKKSSVTQKALKLEQKIVKTAKIVRKTEKESDNLEEKKDLAKKSVKQKFKEKSVTKPVKKQPAKEAVKKGKMSSSGSIEKIDKPPPAKVKKYSVKKLDDKEEKKPKEKVQKEKKAKEIKKKPVVSKATVKKGGVDKSVEDLESVKPRAEVKTDKKDKPKKAKVVAKNKVKLNSAKKVEDVPLIDCMDVVKDENEDDVALLQMFQLKNGPVCDFDGSVCNTITIRQDNTCIKIKEISVSQLPYSVKTEENEKPPTDVITGSLKKECKPIAESQNSEKLVVNKPKAEKQKSEKPKSEKPKAEKQKAEKPKISKRKSEKPKVEKPKAVKSKNEKTKADDKQQLKCVEDKPAAKSAVKAEKKKKPVSAGTAAAVDDKIKPKGKKTKVVAKAKAKGRPISKRPRVASLNAIAKVHCLYENESKSALIDAMAASAVPAAVVPAVATAAKMTAKDKRALDTEMPARKGKRTSKRTTPGLKSVGRHWDMHDTSSTNSSSSSGNCFIVSLFACFFSIVPKQLRHFFS